MKKDDYNLHLADAELNRIENDQVELVSDEKYFDLFVDEYGYDVDGSTFCHDIIKHQPAHAELKKLINWT